MIRFRARRRGGRRYHGIPKFARAYHGSPAPTRQTLLGEIAVLVISIPADRQR